MLAIQLKNKGTLINCFQVGAGISFFGDRGRKFFSQRRQLNRQGKEQSHPGLSYQAEVLLSNDRKCK
jgi:hypothetical protein